jgi:hypothetical protein
LYSTDNAFQVLGVRVRYNIKAHFTLAVGCGREVLKRIFCCSSKEDFEASSPLNRATTGISNGTYAKVKRIKNKPETDTEHVCL